VDKTGQVAARFEPKTAPTAPELKQAVDKAVGA
jgi:glutathione peroxidase-family protein